MAKNTIRIRLKAYEHRILDDSAKKIVETVTKHGAKKVAVSYTHLFDNYAKICDYICTCLLWERSCK